MTTLVVLMMLHIAKSANESSVVVHNYQQITTISGKLFHFLISLLLQTTKLPASTDGRNMFFKIKKKGLNLI